MARRWQPRRVGDGRDPGLFSGLPTRTVRHHRRQRRSPAMMRSLWISKTGMEAQQTQLDTISNNLANVSTNGYKRSRAVFEDLMYQNLRQAGASEQRADAAADRPAGRPRHARRRDRAQLQPGQPAAEREPARRRDPRQRLLPDPDARRHHRLHARRLVPGRRDRPARHQQRLHGAARHHDPGRRRRA